MPALSQPEAGLEVAPEDNQPALDQEMYQETEPNPDGFFADVSSHDQAQSVRVALRVRPLLPREHLENARVVVDVHQEENQVLIGPEQRCFTFDRAFTMLDSQQSVFDACVKNLVLGCFAGFNATVLAYGQTGSGKTYTMGSGFVNGIAEEDLGIIPRVIHLIFEEEAKRRSKAEFIIKCSFLEIYNEELIDLLDSQIGDRLPPKREISIREEKNGTISVYGLQEVKVTSAEQMAECLDNGSHARRTASTLMNQQSSRSHGIFTISIEQHLLVQDGEEGNKNEFTVAKFHFVDLAGSERTKKTGAEGKTLKEGININKSLLALGQVISALTDTEKKSGHIPYRDSKLTRILQDSLGGNSRTSMIACCSPAESSYDETLNTLKYAARARNITNKPVVNRDPASQQIMNLRQQVYDLQKEMSQWRRIMLKNGIEVETKSELPPDGSFQEDRPSVPHSDNGALELMISDLQKRLQFKDSELMRLTQKISDLKSEAQQYQVEAFASLKERDETLLKCQNLAAQLKEAGLMAQEPETDILQEYQLRCQEQEQAQRILKEEVKSLQEANLQLLQQAALDTESLEKSCAQIEKLKLQVEQLKATQLTQHVAQMQKKGSARKPSSKPQAQGQWLSTDLEVKIKHLDDIRQKFIENLGDQMTKMMQPLTGMGNASADALPSGENEDEVMRSEASESDDENGASQDEQDIPEPGVSAHQLHQDEQALQDQEKLVIALDTQMNQKEQILAQFKKAQQELQDSLLSEMKQQYHQRVEALQQELLKLDQARQQEVSKTTSAVSRQKLEQAYTSKQSELQQQLQLLAKKDLETRQMKKKLDSYHSQVSKLETELRQIKTQKVQLHKKIKEDTDRVQKQRQLQQKELVRLRQQVLKADREKEGFKQEAIKQQLQAKRKQEELASLQRRQKQDQQKKTGALEQRQALRQVDRDALRKFILTELEKMLQYKQVTETRDQKHQEFAQLEEEISMLQQQYAQCSVQQERVEQGLSVAGPSFDQLKEQLSELQQQQSDMRSELETLGSKQRFLNAQIIELGQQLHQLRPSQLDSSLMRNLEGAKACILIFFQLLFEARLDVEQSQKDKQLKAQEIQLIEQKIEEQQQVYLQEKKKIMREFNQTQLQTRKKQKVWFDMLIQKTGFDISQHEMQDGDISRLLELCFTSQQKQLMHLGSDNLGINKQALQQIGRVVDSNTRIAQKPSLSDARNARKAQQKQEEPKAPLKKPGVKEQKSVEEVEFCDQDSSKLWNLAIHKPDAHKTGVTAVATFEQRLFSAANKSLKIWDIETMTSVSELMDFGLVKDIQISNKHQLLIIAADKQILMWDLVSLSKVAQYQSPNEIKSLCMVDEKSLLCAGTRGTTTSGALLLFDLRKQRDQPYDQKEYNQDIQALAFQQDTLFASMRNVVTPFNFTHWQTMQPYPAAHTDTITALVSTPAALISGSRDRSIRSYALTKPETLNQITNAHNDMITCLAPSEQGDTFFSGSRDGVVKEWTSGLTLRYEFAPQNTQINAITALSSQHFGKAIAVAQSDRSIKVWRENANFKQPVAAPESSSALSALKSHKISKKQK